MTRPTYCVSCLGCGLPLIAHFLSLRLAPMPVCMLLPTRSFIVVQGYGRLAEQLAARARS